LRPSFQPWKWTSSISSTVAVSGRLTVLEIAPERNGCTAAIIRTWPIGAMARSPIAQSKIS
jgi:hypothetical protein